jgi:hypothetical protein
MTAQSEGPYGVVGPDEVSRPVATQTASSIRGSINASPSNIQGGSRMRESRTYGFVRGAHSDMRPYRDPHYGFRRMTRGIRRAAVSEN